MLNVFHHYLFAKVGDDKSPKDWALDGVIFLSVEAQLNLPFRFAKLVPHRNYARKVVGYLYAIQHGAKQIYETDDDNAPKPGKLPLYCMV